MNKVIEFLKENPVQYLATVGRNGKAKCTEKPHLKTTWLQKKCV